MKKIGGHTMAQKGEVAKDLRVYGGQEKGGQELRASKISSEMVKSVAADDNDDRWLVL